MLLSPLRSLRDMPAEQEADPFRVPLGATAPVTGRLDA
jgi:hypothetical protein